MINTSTSPFGQRHLSKGAVGQFSLFPRLDLHPESNIVDITEQPVVFLGSEFPPGVVARIQVSPDRARWQDWKIEGQFVSLSSEHNLQWVNFSGGYRIRLVDAAGAEYRGTEQPHIQWYAATTTHERDWDLIDKHRIGPQGIQGEKGDQGIPGPQVVSNVLEARVDPITGAHQIQSTINGVMSGWVTLPHLCTAIGE